MPKLDTISETASPAPWRRACMRTNQFPIPASGARIARFGSWTPPSSKGSVSEGLCDTLLHNVERGVHEAVICDQRLVVDRVGMRIERRIETAQPVRLDRELAHGPVERSVHERVAGDHVHH